MVDIVGRTIVPEEFVAVMGYDSLLVGKVTEVHDKDAVIEVLGDDSRMIKALKSNVVCKIEDTSFRDHGIAMSHIKPLLAK